MRAAQLVWSEWAYLGAYFFVSSLRAFHRSAQTTLNQTLSSAIATQLTILPLVSPQSGFTFKYDPVTGAIVRTTSSFGPVYTERAETIGRGKFSFGVSYQRFRFNSIDGVNLHQLPAVFAHVPDTGPGVSPEPYEADIVSTTNDIDLEMDQTMLYGTAGITDRIDVSVAIPIVDVRLGVSSYANIIRVSGPTFVFNGQTFSNPHMFIGGGLSSTFAPPVTSAFGIGDVTFRVKGSAYNGKNVHLALALDIRAPTGDPWKLLGSGAIGLKPFMAVSRVGRISPHFNTGFQWNGSSILAGNITGITGITVDPATGVPTPQGSGRATKARLPGQYLYSAGIDAGVTKKIDAGGRLSGPVTDQHPARLRGHVHHIAACGSAYNACCLPHDLRRQGHGWLEQRGDWPEVRSFRSSAPDRRPSIPSRQSRPSPNGHAAGGTLLRFRSLSPGARRGIRGRVAARIWGCSRPVVSAPNAGKTTGGATYYELSASASRGPQTKDRRVRRRR